jgi:hypothetical protein
MGGYDDVVDLMISMFNSSCSSCRNIGISFYKELYVLRDSEILQGVKVVEGFLKGEKLIDRVMVGAL